MIDKKIGLALGGGGARGLAHIGVLKVLQEVGIPIFALSGTSMGGVIAAAFAVGYSPEQLYEEAMRATQLRQLVRLVDPTPARHGLMEGNRVKAYLRKLIGKDKTFADIQLPLAICAVDINSAEEVILSEGELLPALFATISVPGIFSPAKIGERLLVDGGVLNNVPADLVQGLGAEFVIAVDVWSNLGLNALDDQENITQPFPFPVPGFFQDFYQAMLIMVSAQTAQKLKKANPEIIIQPNIPLDISVFFGFPRAVEIIAAGEKAAREALPEIRKKLRG
jgi:NTE family protein